MGDSASFLSQSSDAPADPRVMQVILDSGADVTAACALRREGGAWWFVVVVEGDPKATALRGYEALVKAGVPGCVLSSLMFVRPTSPLGAAVVAFKAARERGASYDYTSMGGHDFEAYRFYF